MNKSCESCPGKDIPEDMREEMFRMFFGRELECPRNDAKITCIYSKADINWDYMFQQLRKQREEKEKHAKH
jgi:hypothetical protein